MEILPYPYYLYAIVPREFVHNGKNIVKFGRTSHGFDQRISSYPKGSLLLAVCPIKPDDIVVAETQLLLAARLMFTQSTEYGSEYFEGDRVELVDMMNKITKKYTASTEDTQTFAKTSFVPKQKNKKKKTTLQTNGENDSKPTEPNAPVDTENVNRCATPTIDTSIHVNIANMNDGATITIDPNTPVNIANMNSCANEPDVENESRKKQILSMDSHQRFFEFTQLYGDELIGKTHNIMELFNKYKAWLDLPNDKTPYFTFEQLLKSIGGVIKKDVDEWNVVFKAKPKPEVVNPINYELNEYLSMPDMARGYKISKVPGRVTWLSEFKRIFTEFYIDVKISPCDYAKALRKFDFKVSTDYQYICRTCGQLASGKPKCCPGYNGITRLKKFVIYDMDMTKCTSIG
jgi:hypothetical protein